MSVVVFFLLALACLLYMGSPLVMQKYWPALKSSPLSELQRARKEGIWAISDVDNEYEMGKLTEADHAYLRQRLKAELLVVMEQEKKLTEDISMPAEDSDISPPLKKNLLAEVLRVCGIQRP